MNLAAALLASIALVAGDDDAPARRAPGLRFEVSVSAEASAEPVTGRLIVVVARSPTPEPRLTISPQGPAIFGLDLMELGPEETAVVDERALGFPRPLDELPPGDWHAQALIRVYEQVRRADGRELWLPMNDGHQESFAVAAANLYSDVVPLRAGDTGAVELVVRRRNAPASRPADTAWVKRVSIQSRKLTEFWGRPIQIHATVLLPAGYADHPDARYPCVYTLGHTVPFSFTTGTTSTTGTTAPPLPAERGRIDPASGLESGADFGAVWQGPGFPRLIAVSFEQQTPFFPDSYSVNSANQGPYGDAIVDEVIPELERRFRILAEPWARHVEGASTGGWQALALELQHPDFFGGAWVLQPDPIDFRRYQLVDLERDANAFVMPLGNSGAVVERPFRRTVEGQTLWTVRQLSRFEEVLGSHGRSGYQLEGWEAVFGPVGEDGYPKPLWDKLTGAIDRTVVESMREHGYDLRDYAQRNWATLGPKLAGKLHFFAGDMDDFFLNLAVYRFEEFCRAATDPASDAEFTYGRPMKGHGWHAWPWSEFVRRVAATMKRE